MKKGVLFLNGEPPKAALIEKAVSQGVPVYCTDGAYAYLSAVRVPDTVIGDFDSFAVKDVCESCETIAFSADKDYTDGFLAVKIMIERGFTDIDIFGAYGGRPDMAESNFALLAYALKKGVKAVFCGEMNTYLVRGKFTANTQIGATVSIVPFSDKVHILYTKGLKYALSDYEMCKFDNVDSPDYIMGVSNESAEENVEVETDGGTALLFVRERR